MFRPLITDRIVCVLLTGAKKFQVKMNSQHFIEALLTMSASNSVIPHWACSCTVLSEAVHWLYKLYKCFTRGQPVEFYIKSRPKRKILDGRIHKSSSASSSISSLTEGSGSSSVKLWFQKLPSRSKQKPGNCNLKQLSSTISTASVNTSADEATKEPETIEKRTDEVADQRKEDKLDFWGSGDCGFDSKISPRKTRKRIRRRTMFRKTRSGKIYSYCVI